MTEASGSDQTKAASGVLLVRDAARQFAPDHYVSALLAPATGRDDLIALAAFWGETRRIAHEVSDPMLAEIRLQWWRDALSEGAGPSGHPVADAMQGLLKRHPMLRGEVDRLLEGRLAELDALSFESEDGFRQYVLDCDGALLTMKSHLSGLDPASLPEGLIGDAARALGALRVALDLPFFAAHRRLPLWPEAFGWDRSVSSVKPTAEDGRRAVATLIGIAQDARRSVIGKLRESPPEAVSVVLPLAVQKPYVKALQAPGHDSFRNIAALSPLNRFVRLIWAHWLKRL